MGNTNSNNTDGSNFSKDLEYCVVKHTVNLDGFRGAAGDINALNCVIDRVSSRIASEITGVSSGDVMSNNNLTENSKYTKPGSNIICMVVNGKCYAIYEHGVITRYHDRQGNKCESNGQLIDMSNNVGGSE